tara:strand:+ start:252 stop:497 length:246 start_codon:yes stop_codon:yes gene_type:complete
MSDHGNPEKAILLRYSTADKVSTVVNTKPCLLDINIDIPYAKSQNKDKPADKENNAKGASHLLFEPGIRNGSIIQKSDIIK